MEETLLPVKRRVKKPLYKRFKNEIKAYSLIALPLAWWIVFFVVAFISALVFSFTNMLTAYDDVTKFTFDNYERLFNPFMKKFDPLFWKSLGITMIWTIVMMIGNNLMGLVLSFMLSSIKRGRKLFLGLLFWPSLVSAVVGADLSKMLFSSDSSGLMNKIISLFGLSPVAWFDNSSTALFALMLTPFLLGFCTKLLIYYAAVLGIPETYYEAARLETGNRVKMFWHITLPLIKNAIVLNMVLSLIDGIKVLGPMQLITKGGPNGSTTSSVLYIYQLGFERGYMGRASAYAFVLFAIILILTVIQMKLSGKEGESFA